jgi:hypothetical protein
MLLDSSSEKQEVAGRIRQSATISGIGGIPATQLREDLKHYMFPLRSPIKDRRATVVTAP